MKSIFKRQKYLMEEVYKISHDRKSQVECYRTTTLAAVDELMEALHHVPWKPWSKRELWDWEELYAELADVFTFFVQLCVLVGIDADKLKELYFQKSKINKARQDSGTYGIDAPDFKITQSQLEELYSVAENGDCTTSKVGCLILSENGDESWGWNVSVDGEPCTHKASEGCPGRTIHAEVSALSQAALLGHKIPGSTAFTTKEPCDRCYSTLRAAGVAGFWVV